MGCGCGRKASTPGNGNRGTTLGFRAFLPSGEVVPARDQVPYFMAAEALREVTAARGGTVRRIDASDSEDAYAIGKRTQSA